MPAVCTGCEQPIERDRAALFMTTCLKCAKNDRTPVKAVLVYGHKTGGEVLTARGTEQVRQANRFIRRAR